MGHLALCNLKPCSSTLSGPLACSTLCCYLLLGDAGVELQRMLLHGIHSANDTLERLAVRSSHISCAEAGCITCLLRPKTSMVVHMAA
jgi:hypothetical protein